MTRSKLIVKLWQLIGKFSFLLSQLLKVTTQKNAQIYKKKNHPGEMEDSEVKYSTVEYSTKKKKKMSKKLRANIVEGSVAI